MCTYNRQIVAVTNRALCMRPFLEQVERVCRFRPAAILLREKDLDETTYEALAADVMRVCKQYRVPCILHSFLKAAERLHAEQIHLPLGQLTEAAADPRQPLQRFSMVGTSVHSVRDAVRAEELGVSYVTAGHIYATDCKKGLPPKGLDFLRDVCRNVSIPVYAIGGIKCDPAQVREILSCGAKRACIMSGMMAL